MPAIGEFAPAKVNLTLRVLGRRPDGYHEIESLVAFAEDVGDRVVLEPGGEAAVRATGPFAAAIAGDNLAMIALERLRQAEPRLTLGTVTLDKCLPVASGLGGGSADAAAVLRAVRRLNPELASAVDWQGLASRLGADVPVCLTARASLMRGIGDRVSPLPNLPPLFVVLVNPKVDVPADKTARVFRMLGAKSTEAGARPTASDRDSPPPNLPREGGGTASREWPWSAPPGGSLGEHQRSPKANPSTPAQRGSSPLAGEGRRGEVPASTLGALLAAQGNDLEAPARTLMPQIGAVLETLRHLPGCSLARLSGAGPTCFGLFETRDAANAACERIGVRHLGWWVRVSVLR